MSLRLAHLPPPPLGAAGRIVFFTDQRRVQRPFSEAIALYAAVAVGKRASLQTYNVKLLLHTVSQSNQIVCLEDQLSLSKQLIVVIITVH